MSHSTSSDASAVDCQLRHDNGRAADINGGESVILILMSKGSSDEEIGRLLAMAPHRVTQVSDRACSKLGLKSRLAAAVWVIKNRLDAGTTEETVYPIHPLHPPPSHLLAI